MPGIWRGPATGLVAAQTAQPSRKAGVATALAATPYKQEVAGSSPAPPTREGAPRKPTIRCPNVRGQSLAISAAGEEERRPRRVHPRAQLALVRKRLCFHRGVETRSEGGSKTDLLGKADGYAVFDLRGRRIGLVIELVDDPDSGGQRLAIRRDGVFIWRRRLLPLEAIESVNAERRLVVVAEDREPDGAAAWDEPTGGDLLGRIDAYTRPESIANGEEALRTLDVEERSERLLAPAGIDRHLRFVSTPDGYRLGERDGEPPAVGTRISGLDLPEPLKVVKIGPSPLPDDARVCAFLERENPLAASAEQRRAQDFTAPDLAGRSHE